MKRSQRKPTKPVGAEPGTDQFVDGCPWRGLPGQTTITNVPKCLAWVNDHSYPPIEPDWAAAAALTLADLLPTLVRDSSLGATPFGWVLPT